MRACAVAPALGTHTLHACWPEAEAAAGGGAQGDGLAVLVGGGQGDGGRGTHPLSHRGAGDRLHRRHDVRLNPSKLLSMHLYLMHGAWHMGLGTHPSCRPGPAYVRDGGDWLHGRHDVRPSPCDAPLLDAWGPMSCVWKPGHRNGPRTGRLSACLSLMHGGLDASAASGSIGRQSRGCAALFLLLVCRAASQPAVCHQLQNTVLTCMP